MPELIAPLAGNVWKVLIAVGDKVEMDDEVIILEALKMETPIFCDDGGTITEIRVNEGDVLAVIG
jgi:acetyl-CoA carboxylase biotin carboxyl carrier protein